MIERVEIGNAVLYRGDACRILDELAGGETRADALITDPPYCSGRVRAKGASTNAKYLGRSAKRYPEFFGDDRDQRAFGLWVCLWCSTALSMLRRGSPMLCFTDWSQLPSMSDALQVAGMVWRGIAVWDKTEGVRPQQGRFRNQCEFILWGSHGPFKAHDPTPYAGLCRVPVVAKRKHHAAGKPIPLMHHLMQITKPGAVVLDPFMGSGSTGVAALEMGRKFIGIELQPEYFEIACQRIEQAACVATSAAVEE